MIRQHQEAQEIMNEVFKDKNLYLEGTMTAIRGRLTSGNEMVLFLIVPRRGDIKYYKKAVDKDKIALSQIVKRNGMLKMKLSLGDTSANRHYSVLVQKDMTDIYLKTLENQTEIYVFFAEANGKFINFRGTDMQSVEI